MVDFVVCDFEVVGGVDVDLFEFILAGSEVELSLFDLFVIDFFIDVVEVGVARVVFEFLVALVADDEVVAEARAPG